MMAWRIAGGEVLRGGRLAPGELHLPRGCVTGAAGPAAVFDATGLLVLPGIVDIHGDAHERAQEPRPGVSFPTPFALADSARQCLAAGITTAYLGVTLSWEPGLRSIEAFRAWLAALERAPRGTELRVHLRFEADNFDAMDEACAAIAAGRVQLLGFNDHTPTILRQLGDTKKIAKYAGRAGMQEDAFRDLVQSIAARRGEVPVGRARMAEAARRAGIPMLSHDDATREDRLGFRALGAAICEFPMAEEVAEAARAAGEHVVMGAPNVVRGGSHLGWASAAPLAERGLVTILASDYHWPALFEAPFRLADRGKLSLAEAWALVSANPAEALGLRDRGVLEEGRRGDVVLADPASRSPAAVFVAGELAWLAPGAASRLAAQAA
jgi:alpha-D-ribose 1-methylphosphonate 5-triphosphate diphosphatase